MDIVDQTLKHWRSTPFSYGSDDCVLSVLRYAHNAGALNAVPLYEGRYDDQEGAFALMAESGGFDAVIESSGVKRVDGKPDRGDIVGLMASDGDVIGALCTGDMVAARLERGVVEARLGLVGIKGVWRVVR